MKTYIIDSRILKLSQQLAKQKKGLTTGSARQTQETINRLKLWKHQLNNK